ncbi:MAG: type I-E CRISPR-associated protein Cas5/CasD [Kiritimatiellia bacterium]|jgi:CRISPR system Cascade subunit CasD|nr:type I-E CRISPR-associated protein Cas5/CasD [Kiritimatiellia bacterium]
MSDRLYLALYFDAPLQSWGYASKFDRRTTLAHPTRSGVIGLLCAASGVDRTDTEKLQYLDEALEIEAYTFKQGTRLIDYHTVGGGYDPETQKASVCKTGKGEVRKKNKVSLAVLTYREYLEDTRCGAVVSGEAGLIRELAGHVENPVWGIWLGRKACVPAARVFEGVHADCASAVAALSQAAGGGSPIRVVRTAEIFEEGTDTLMDRPRCFDTNARQFAPRRICVDTE